MNESLKAKMALAADLLNEDGSVTPADNLPQWLLTEEGSHGIEQDFTEAILAESLSEAFKLARQRSMLTMQALAERRQISKGRISQIEKTSENSKLSSLAEHAAALGYDIQVVMTPRASNAHQRIVVPIPSTQMAALANAGQ